MWLADSALKIIDGLLPSLTVIVTCNRNFIVRRYWNIVKLWRASGFLLFLLFLGFLFIEPFRLPSAHFFQLFVGLGRWYVKWIPLIYAIEDTLETLVATQDAAEK